MANTPLSHATGIDLGQGTVASLAAGTYTPATSNPVNVSSITAHPHTYVRIGNVVVVYGRISLTVGTSGSDCLLDISLPVAPSANFANSYDAFGSGILQKGSTNNKDATIIIAVSLTKTVQIVTDAVSIPNGTSASWAYSFSYSV